MEVSLRPVTRDDRRFLLRVYADTRSDEMALVSWTEDEKHAFVEMQFDAQAADYTTRFPRAEHSVVLAGDSAVGRIWVDRQEQEIRLLDVAMLADHRNRGIGAVLLGDLQAEAIARRLPLRHSVYKANEAAIRFYERLGFRMIEDFDTYLLMEWRPPDTDQG